MHNNVSLLYCTSALGLAAHLFLKEALSLQLILSCHSEYTPGAGGEQDTQPGAQLRDALSGAQVSSDPQRTLTAVLSLAQGCQELGSLEGDTQDKCDRLTLSLWNCTV